MTEAELDFLVRVIKEEGKLRLAEIILPANICAQSLAKYLKKKGNWQLDHYNDNPGCPAVYIVIDSDDCRLQLILLQYHVEIFMRQHVQASHAEVEACRHIRDRWQA